MSTDELWLVATVIAAVVAVAIVMAVAFEAIANKPKFISAQLS